MSSVDLEEGQQEECHEMMEQKLGLDDVENPSAAVVKGQECAP